MNGGLWIDFPDISRRSHKNYTVCMIPDITLMYQVCPGGFLHCTIRLASVTFPRQTIFCENKAVFGRIPHSSLGLPLLK